MSGADPIAQAMGLGIPPVFQETLRFLDRMAHAFSKNAAPIVVHTRRDLRREQLLLRLRRRAISRQYRRITGASLFAAHRARGRRKP